MQQSRAVLGRRRVHPDIGPKAALDAYTRDALDADALIAALMRVCCSDADTVETVSLLEQYHRRGLLDTGVFLTAKTELSTQIFGSRPSLRANAADLPSPSALDQFSSGALG
jgi:hypothetical protein